jgi:hypothetical protein
VKCLPQGSLFPPFATAGFSIPQFSSVSRLSAGDFFIFLLVYACFYFFVHFFVNFLPISLSFLPFLAADFKNIA